MMGSSGGWSSSCKEKGVAMAAIFDDHGGTPTARVDRRPRGERGCSCGVFREEKRG
jgi:hypothetical protein